MRQNNHQGGFGVSLTMCIFILYLWNVVIEKVCRAIEKLIDGIYGIVVYGYGDQYVVDIQAVSVLH